MSGFDDEMQRALEADGEKLRQLTGEDRGPFEWPPAIRSLRSLNWKAQDPDSTDERWIADAFTFFYHIHSNWHGRQRGSTYTVWVTPGTTPDLNRWETAGYLSLGEFDSFGKAASAAKAHIQFEWTGSLTAEQRETLASIVHDLREHSDAIHKGIAEHGSYTVPWSVLSWGKDMAARDAERIEEIIGDTCRQCGGKGIIDNPEARYEMDRDTGSMETNDPEEIECERCDGTGLEPKKRPEIAEEEIAF